MKSHVVRSESGDDNSDLRSRALMFALLSQLHCAAASLHGTL